MAGELTTLSLAMGRGVVSGGVVPVPPETIVVNGVTYNLLYSRVNGDYLTSRTNSEPLYGRAA